MNRKLARINTDFGPQDYASKSFSEQFAATPPGPQREQLVYRAIVGQGKPTDLYPITVNAPDGYKLTYYITRDFLNVPGNPGDPNSQTILTPMTGTTLQKIADYFHMYIPTVKMADQVCEEANKKKSAVTVHPLSGTGYQGADRYYSAQEVVSGRIGATDAAMAFSKKLQ